MARSPRFKPKIDSIPNAEINLALMISLTKLPQFTILLDPSATTYHITTLPKCNTLHQQRGCST